MGSDRAMSLLDCISRFSTAAMDGTPSGYLITRTAPGSYDANGLWVAGSTSTVTTDASVQPYDDSLEVLPTGVRREDVRVLFTPIALTKTPTPDAITIAGESFHVFEVNGPFNMSGVSTWRSYAARMVIP
jgi:hypothetical protein